MKIAVVVSTFPKISETFILNQVTGLISRGHQVHIFSRFKPIELIAHPDIQKYDLLKKTVYFPPIPRSKWLCRFKAAAWILLSFFYRPPVVIKTLRHLLCRKKPFSYPILFSALAVLRTKPDIIHIHYGHNGNLFLPLKQIDPPVGFLTMFHGHDVRLGTEGGKNFYTDLFSKADRILANSKHTRRALLEQEADPQRTHVHHVGIELNKYLFQKADSRTLEKYLRILTVSRLHADKGIEYSIRAIHHLIRTYPSVSVEYRIVGNGPLEEPLKQLVQDLNLSKHVSFLDVLEQTEVIKQLHEADVFLLTSLHEGLGMALLEAQAVGLPVVATQVDGIPEAVDPGRSAILIPPRNPQAAAEALAQLLKNPDQRVQMGQAGRQHVEKHFNIEALNDKLEETYRDLCRDLKRDPAK